MCDRDVIEHSARVLGGAVTPVTPRNSKHRPSYVTSVKGKPAIRLMIELAPFMSGARRRQIRRALRDVVPIRLPASAWTPTVPLLAGLLEGEGTFTAKAAAARG